MDTPDFDMAVSAPEIVIIDGQLYSLEQIPDEKSAIVVSERTVLLKNVDVETLATDLGRVGGFIRIAYNGVGAAGSQFTTQQVKIQRLGYDISKLCDKSAVIIVKFKEASRSIVIDLQATYAYLLDNLEEIAVDTLSAVSKIAEQMEKEALELKSEFYCEADKVLAILDDTEEAKGNFDRQKIEKEKEREKFKAEKKKEKQLIKEKQAKETEAEIRRKKLEGEEDEATALIGDISGQWSFLKELFNGLIATKHFKADGEEKAATIRKQRLEALKEEQAIREERHAAIVRMSDFTVKIKQCKTEKNMSKFAVEALHEAAGALKHLSVVMNKAAQFWKQMQVHCSLIEESNMKSQVELALKTYAEDKRRKLWTSNGFKVKAMRFYAKWVALHGVCDFYMKGIKETQQELYKYLTENPTWEESHDNLQKMAENFYAVLQEDQKAISEQDSKAQEEIKALTESND